MSIVKMKSITIAGPIGEFERIVSKYIYGQDIHLENALSVLSYRQQLHTFDEEDKYGPIVKNIENIINQANMKLKKTNSEQEYSYEEMASFVEEINLKIQQESDRTSAIDTELIKNEQLLKDLDTVMDLNVDLSKLFDFKFINFKFGHIPKSGYKTLNTYLRNLDAIFVKTKEDNQDVWGFYFAPVVRASKVDEVFASLYFEEVNIPEELRGVPKDIRDNLIKENEKITKEKQQISEKTHEILKLYYDKICRIYEIAKRRQLFTEIRKNAVHSEEFFYIVGWMSKKDAKLLEEKIKVENDIVLCVTTDPDKISHVKPPTKLKNNPIFRPFEFFVKMYGLPNYNEIDPTPVLAMTYILFFGIMFGDVGQSAIFAIIGFLMYKIKKVPLFGIIGMVGLSGILFGFVYGSIFGNEEILPHLISPMHSINQMLGITIGMGVFFIIVGLMLNIINSIKSGNIGKAIFGHNGLSGLIFYVTLIATVLGSLLKLFTIPAAVSGTIIGISILCMYLGEPLSKLVNGEKKWFPTDGMFYVENLFEMFEVLLSYFTNTISFLRIGAFAIVHVGMMMVVAVLSKNGGIGGIIVMVLGNILVMGLEGLIVGIQVLRLEYYELFSRYFTGQGKEFISLNNKKS